MFHPISVADAKKEAARAIKRGGRGHDVALAHRNFALACLRNYQNGYVTRLDALCGARHHLRIARAAERMASYGPAARHLGFKAHVAEFLITNPR